MTAAARKFLLALLAALMQILPSHAAVSLPGIIQAEDYRPGGAFAAFYDRSPGNAGGVFRYDDVDLAGCSEGGYAIGWIEGGEWVKYDVTVAQSGIYDIDLRVARGIDGSGFVHVQVDGKSVTGAMTVPATGGWQNWATITSHNIALAAGSHEVALFMETGDFNVNWIQFRVATFSPDWQLAWGDEFDAGVINTGIWNFDQGGGGWGHNELQCYTNRWENARVEQGDLVIEARREWMGNNAYTSARMNTKWKKQFQYGKIEARILLPTGKGLWPAFWMIGNDIDWAGWPGCGEIDIMEGRGSQPYSTICAMHGPGYSGNTPIGASYWSGSRLHGAYHVYSVEWGPGYANFFVDGNFFYSATPASVPGPWVFDKPFFLIFNLAVGGNFDGEPDGWTAFPQQMRVDWVRAYQKKPTGYVGLTSCPSSVGPSGSAWCAFEYSASVNMDVLVDLVNADGNWVTGSKTGVAAGNAKTGGVTVNYNNLPAGNYTWTAHLVPAGGNWTQAISTSKWATSVIAPTGNVAISYAPVEIATSGSSAIFFNYSASVNMDVIADLVSSTGKWVAGSRTSAAAGQNKSGSVTVYYSGLAAGSYTWNVHLVPTGGSWQQAVGTSKQAVNVVSTRKGRR